MKLIVLKNNVPVGEFQVDTPDLNERYEIFVGRAEDCHVLIDDPLISRHHFVIKNEGSEWLCQKLSQLGVVLVNGSAGPTTKIKDGDEIRCGAYSVFVTELPAAPTAAPQIAVPVEPVIPEPAPSVEEATAVVPSDEDLAEPSMVTSSQEEEPTEGASEEVLEQPESQDLGGDDLGNAFGEEIEPEEDGLDNAFGDENLPVSDEFGGEASTLDGFPGEGAMMEQEEGTRVFRAFVNYQLVLTGEHAPYDRYQIETDEIFIGRDNKKCQIILNDPEVSSVHAVLRKDGNEITLEDLNSSNGSILNGERINKAQLNTGDNFVIGSTTFALEVKSDLLEAEAERLMPVESGQVIEHEEIEEEEISADDAIEINFGDDTPQEKSIIKRILKDPQQRKKAIYAVVVAGLAWVILGEDPSVEAPAEKPKVAKEAKPAEQGPPKIQLSKELENKRNVAYELGVSFFEQNKYFEAEKEFQTVVEIDPQYKKVQTYLEQSKLGLKRLEELEAQRRAEEERIKTKKLIEELLVKARDAVKEKKVQVAESYFAQIIEKDPENIEVSQLKLELEAWQKAEEKKALEKAIREKNRKNMVDALAPGKTHYLKHEWYRAVLRLEEFLRKPGMDEDLVKEASDMLADAKNQLAAELGPLLGKARSLKEGQDYKSAYEAFLEVLKVEPTNAEALNEVDDIKNQLDNRSKRIYREAIIAESLSLFNDAKEKFQEVQQISPTDSEYYKKASEKLRNYYVE